MSTDPSLASDLAREFGRWASGKVPIETLPIELNPHTLKTLACSSQLNSETVKLLNTIIDALQSKFPDPFCTPEFQNQLCIYPKKTEASDNLDEINDDEAVEDPEKPFPDILESRLAALGLASPKTFSGATTFRELHSFELEQAFLRILSLSEGNLSDEAFTAEIAFHFGVTPNQFHQIPTRDTKNESSAIRFTEVAVHIDLNYLTGLSSQAKIESRRDAVIPLPLEFTNRIRRRLEKAPEAQNFSELFTDSMPELLKKTRSMLKSISSTSHHVTLARLARSKGRYSLELSKDEAYSALVGLDLTLGTIANFNYLTIRGERLKSILQTLYKNLGYDKSLSTNKINDVLSPRLPEAGKLSCMLRNITTESVKLIKALPKNCKTETIISTHNQIVSNIYTLTKLLTGSRPLEIETITRSQLDLQQRIACITDKRISPYHELRIISLPEYLTDWLKAYTQWLKLLAFRLSSIQPNLSELIYNCSDQSQDGKDTHPLFFYLTGELQSTPIGSGILNQTLIKNGFSSNCGRHWIDDVARQENIDSATIMGFFGRGNQGQELFSRWSCAIPISASKNIAKAIDTQLQKFDLPEAPYIHPRKFESITPKNRHSPYHPRLLKIKNSSIYKRSPNTEKKNSEPCPFSRLTISHAARFSEYFRQWRSNPPPDGWLGVVISLILEDGICTPAELEGALQQIFGGTIYQCDGRIFVDSKSRRLGIRRTDISYVTIQLVAKISNKETIPPIEQLLIAEITCWASAGPYTRINELLEACEKYQVLYMPSAVSSWVRGLSYCRTTRPTATARRIFGYIEPPKFNLTHLPPRREKVSEKISTLLSAAYDFRKKGDSHSEILNVLREELELLYPNCDTLTDQIQVGYLLELTKRLSNLKTLLRYENGARAFIKRLADQIQLSGIEQINWKRLIKEEFQSRKVDSPPDQVAINHLLSWLGVDLVTLQRTEAPPHSAKYADMLSARELNMAMELLKNQSQSPGDEYDLACVSIHLLSLHPLRWDSFAHIRLVDIYLEGKNPHITITKSAGADLKTENAIRVIELDNHDLVNHLKSIVSKRLSQFSNDRLTPLLGDEHDPRGNKTADRVHRLITKVLWHVTGSGLVCVHNLRHYSITERIKNLLSPGADSILYPIELRQGLIKCAINAGHSWPQVSLEYYGHDIDRLRTSHHQKITENLAQPSDHFISYITGLNMATLRKRRSRDPDFKPNISSNLNISTFSRFGTKIIHLSSLVCAGQTHMPIKFTDKAHDKHTQEATFIGLRMIGDSKEVAWKSSGLSLKQTEALELYLRLSSESTGIYLENRADINRQRFLQFIQASKLATSMAVTQPDHSILSRLKSSFLKARNEWTLAEFTDAIQLKNWTQAMNSNNISIELIMRQSDVSNKDMLLLHTARENGFLARTLPARHFNRGTKVLLRFSPRKNETSQSQRVRTSPLITFSVSVCALAILSNSNQPEQSK